MTNKLRSAGVREEVLKMIQSTVNSCRACRAFRRPASHSVATSRLPTQFNAVVQHDVLYMITNKRPNCLMGMVANSTDMVFVLSGHKHHHSSS